ncbi:hypothetical protein [uncultured Draconibacterium sp.]|uniref:condensin complex protein MksE n=1 Tax=uncultured Draconibacterium sp. TaxID=1573823 RepID=UPI0032602DC0
MDTGKIPPIETQEIFETLTKGNFISFDSEQTDIQRLHRAIKEDDNYDILFTYFNRIGFQLINGNDHSYYYFTKQETGKKIEDKIKVAYKWIDIYDFFMSYGESKNEYFSAGILISPENIFEECKINTALMDKLTSIQLTKSIANPSDKIKKLIEELKKATFVEEYNSFHNEYKVVSAFEYLEQLIKSIDIITIDEDTTSL